MFPLQRPTALLALLLPFSATLLPRASAQVLYGSMVGNVTDSTNASIPGVSVRVTETRTGGLLNDRLAQIEGTAQVRPVGQFEHRIDQAAGIAAAGQQNGFAAKASGSETKCLRGGVHLHVGPAEDLTRGGARGAGDDYGPRAGGSRVEAGKDSGRRALLRQS